jgi:hypothetical protein
MRLLSRLQPGILLVAALLGAVCCLRPGWARVPGLDFWDVAALGADLEAELERSADLDEENAAVLRRLHTEEEVAEAVLGGRLDLLHAAARIRDVFAPDEKSRHCLEMAYPAVGEDERYCRTVIRWVAALQAVHPPADVRRQAARLEAELDEYRRRDGSITLPRGRAPE